MAGGGREAQGGVCIYLYIYIQMYLIHFIVKQKLAQDSKAIIL